MSKFSATGSGMIANTSVVTAPMTEQMAAIRSSLFILIKMQTQRSRDNSIGFSLKGVLFPPERCESLLHDQNHILN